MALTNEQLYQKYNVPVPRYTSYPTVPDWNEEGFDIESWKNLVRESFEINNNKEGISIYIHLPYCESLCTYCGCNTRITVNHNVEKPYINAVLNEFQLYLDLVEAVPNIKEIHLGGGTPTFFSAENLDFLISSIINKSNLLPDASLSFEAHPTNTTKVHLQTLYNIGFRRLSLGVQDFDPIVQKAINRKQSFEEVKEVVDNARAIGYTSINLDVIYGLPFQKLCSVNNTISKVIELMPNRIAYYSYAHVPWKHGGQRAYSEKDLPSSAAKRNLYEIGRSRLLIAGFKEIGMDHFALPNDELCEALDNGELHRNFMGYITQPSNFLMGLGVSSISDIHTAYAQNQKTVEGYMMKVNNKQFAIQKGHLMSDTEILVKECIHQILCNKTIKIAQLSKLPFELLKTFENEISNYLNEDLLTVNNEQIDITSKGNKFIRNIVASLDEYYTKKANLNKFSSSI